jgi:hypothetical protein
MADPKDEAERLVAAALAAVSMAAQSATGFATGSAECCVCPLCKAIALARDPDPAFAEKLATGVGDLATGVASVLRAFGETDFSFGTGRARSSATDPPSEQTPDDDVWHGATADDDLGAEGK